MLTITDTPTGPTLALRTRVCDLATVLSALSIDLGSLARLVEDDRETRADIAGALRQAADAAYGLAIALLIAADFATLPAVPAEVE